MTTVIDKTTPQEHNVPSCAREAYLRLAQGGHWLDMLSSKEQRDFWRDVQSSLPDEGEGTDRTR